MILLVASLTVKEYSQIIQLDKRHGAWCSKSIPNTKWNDTWQPTSKKTISPVSNAIGHLVKLEILKGICSNPQWSEEDIWWNRSIEEAHDQLMITHTGQKLHKCARCGDSFGLAGNLKQHMLIHIQMPTVRLWIFICSRVYHKMKNPFLWAGLWNPIVSMYKEPKY